MTKSQTWLLLLAAVLAAGCASLAIPGFGAVRVRKEAPFLIARSVSNQWGRVTHPILIPISSNRLVCRYNVCGDIASGQRSIAGADGPSYSDDGGLTWKAGDPFQWAEGPPAVPTYFEAGKRYTNHYGFFWSFAQFPDGRRVGYHRDFRYFFQGYEKAPQFSNTVTWSQDGAIWHGPERVLVDAVPTGSAYRLRGTYEYSYTMILPPRGLVLPDGTLLSAAYNSPAIPNFKYSTLLLESRDQGQSFQSRAVIARTNDVPRADPWGFEGPCEPALARLPDGELLCIMRTGNVMLNQFVWAGYCIEMLEARSKDDGRTWTTRQLHEMRGVMPSLLQMSNGVLALAYGRPGARIAFSLDGGRTWPRTLDLVSYATKTSGYVDLLEVAPGRLLAVYDVFDMPPAKIWLWEPPLPVNTIYGVFIDVAPR